MKREREEKDAEIEGDDSMDEDGDALQAAKKSKGNVEGRVCPWLGTIDRTRLDFDFEKLCSVSLQNANVYACLVCGKVISSYFFNDFSRAIFYLHGLVKSSLLMPRLIVLSSTIKVEVVDPLLIHIASSRTITSS
jgi:hypothetical protein